MNIVLIYPNMGDYRTKDAMTPLAIGILAALSPGHRVTFYDDRLDNIPESLPDADLIAISVETFTAQRSYQLADRFRRQGKTVVMGGCHVTFMPDEALQYADSVLLGDAEGAWEQMLADCEQNALKPRYRGAHDRPPVTALTGPFLRANATRRCRWYSSRAAAGLPVIFALSMHFIRKVCAPGQLMRCGMKFYLCLQSAF